MVAHLPDGHPERNAVESKDLPVVRKILFKGLGTGSGRSLHCGRDDRPVGATSSVVLSMVAHLPDGHPERNAVESKDLPLLEEFYL
ncbi:hypothetical protein [Ravibacter arvi]|uniref:hypothetical protein n=1 Tax=Ravibacter arvi TaxID=2051041 RepID=UPI0031E6E566